MMNHVRLAPPPPPQDAQGDAMVDAPRVGFKVEKRRAETTITKESEALLDTGGMQEFVYDPTSPAEVDEFPPLVPPPKPQELQVDMKGDPIAATA